MWSHLNWRTFSRRVTARWWCQWAKNQVPTNQNSRNRWCQIVRGTICYNLTSTSKYWIKVLRNKSGDEAFQASFKSPRHGWDQRLTDFNRFLQYKHGIVTPVQCLCLRRIYCLLHFSLSMVSDLVSPLVLLVVKGKFSQRPCNWVLISLRESIQVYLSILKRFWIDPLLNFTITMT